MLRACRPRLSTLASASLLVSVFACSSEDDPSAAPPATATATIYTSAFCERLDRCRPRSLRDSFGDVATCTQRFLPDIDDELTSPGVKVTEAQADACAAKMRELPCTVPISAMPECVFSGTLELGPPCGSGYQCRSGSCARAEGSVCGECSARVGANADCSLANCEPGLVCAAGRCRPPAELGEACDAQPCRPGLQCFKGRCEEPLGPGEACVPEPSRDADILDCDGNQLLFCSPSTDDPTKGRCAEVRHAPLGATCGLDRSANTLVACTASSCSAPLLTGGGTCVADLKEGEACGATDAACEVPLYCTKGRCSRFSIHTCN